MRPIAAFLRAVVAWFMNLMPARANAAREASRISLPRDPLLIYNPKSGMIQNVWLPRSIRPRDSPTACGPVMPIDADQGRIKARDSPAN